MLMLLPCTAAHSTHGHKSQRIHHVFCSNRGNKVCRRVSKRRSGCFRHNAPSAILMTSSSSSALTAAAAATAADADVAPIIHNTHAPTIESSPSIARDNALHSRPGLSQSPDSLAFASSQSLDSLKSRDCSLSTHHLKQQQQQRSSISSC